MSQTSYPIEQPIAFVGMLADIGDAYTRSVTNTDAGPVPFGIAVKKGTLDDDAALLAAAPDKPIGVLIATSARDNIGLTGATDAVKAGAKANLLVKGRCYVLPEQVVIPSDTVFVRYAAGAGGTQKGAFRKDVDTASALQWKGARYLTTSTLTVPNIVDVNALVYYW